MSWWFPKYFLLIVFSFVFKISLKYIHLLTWHHYSDKPQALQTQHILNWPCCCCLNAKSCPTLGDLMNCSPLGSSIHGILQARILGWVAISSSKGSSWTRGGTQISCTGGRFFTIQLPWKPPNWLYHFLYSPSFPLLVFPGTDSMESPCCLSSYPRETYFFFFFLCSCTFNKFPSFIDSPFL